MNLQDFKVKPKIISMFIDDPKIVEAYGEPIKFWSYDHISLPQFFAFFKAQSDGDLDKLSEIMRDLLLTEDGKQLLAKDEQLPVDLFTAAVLVLANHLGKSETKNSTLKETGTPQ